MDTIRKIRIKKGITQQQKDRRTPLYTSVRGVREDCSSRKFGKNNLHLQTIMSKTIPNEVKAAAKRLFPHGATYVGDVSGKEVYSAANDPYKEDSSQPAPTGLPTYLLWDGRQVEIVSGLDSLELLSRLQ